MAETDDRQCSRSSRRRRRETVRTVMLSGSRTGSIARCRRHDETGRRPRRRAVRAHRPVRGGGSRTSTHFARAVFLVQALYHKFRCRGHIASAMHVVGHLGDVAGRSRLCMIAEVRTMSSEKRSAYLARPAFGATETTAGQPRSWKRRTGPPSCGPTGDVNKNLCVQIIVTRGRRRRSWSMSATRRTLLFCGRSYGPVERGKTTMDRL